MLRRKDSSEEYKVVDNHLKKSSTAWEIFGFPARKTKEKDDTYTYERIHSFVSCFQCKATYTFQADGSGSTKHLLRHTCQKSLGNRIL